MKIAVTGAGGFVGSHLCVALVAAGHEVREPSALQGADAVVHLANIAHRKADEDELRRVNVEGTRRLVRNAAAAGVPRFLYLSSVKVHGERTTGTPLREESPLAPADAYARSKLEAEEVLAASAKEIATVVFRPPLVYGPRVKANFLALLKAIARGWPLPLASVDNRRSMLYVGNLVDAILLGLASPDAVGRTYLVCDADAHSTADLCRTIGAALGRPARLFSCPPAVLGVLPALRRLTDSLEVDASAIRLALGWSPPFAFEDGIRDTACWYREAFEAGG